MNVIDKINTEMTAAEIEAEINRLQSITNPTDEQITYEGHLLRVLRMKQNTYTAK